MVWSAEMNLAQVEEWTTDSVTGNSCVPWQLEAKEHEDAPKHEKDLPMQDAEYHRATSLIEKKSGPYWDQYVQEQAPAPACTGIDNVAMANSTSKKEINKEGIGRRLQA